MNDRKDGPQSMDEVIRGLSLDSKVRGRQAPKTAAPRAKTVFVPAKDDKPDAELEVTAPTDYMHFDDKQDVLEFDDEPEWDERPNSELKNAAIKEVISRQIEAGEAWNPLFVNDDWVHFLHDFVEGGLLARISGGALKVLLLVKTWASKDTGIARVNQARVAEILNISARQVRRYMSELIDDNFIRQLDTTAGQGRGHDYQVIEHIRMFNALPTSPNEQTIVEAAFPYAGKRFKETTTVARQFARTGHVPANAVSSLELTPLKSPFITAAPAVAANRTLQQDNTTVVQNITLNVTGDVKAPINIHTAGIVQQKREDFGDVNMPDGSGNPLKTALRRVKLRQREDGEFEPPEDN